MWDALHSVCRARLKPRDSLSSGTLRRQRCGNFGGEPLNDGTVTVTASCIAEGNTEEREIALTLPDRGTLRIGTPDNPAAAELVRCHLPGQQ